MRLMRHDTEHAAAIRARILEAVQYGERSKQELAELIDDATADEIYQSVDWMKVNRQLTKRRDGRRMVYGRRQDERAPETGEPCGAVHLRVHQAFRADV